MSKGDLVLSLAGLGALAGQLRSIKERMDDTGQVDRKLGNGELGSSAAFDAAYPEKRAGRSSAAQLEMFTTWPDSRSIIVGSNPRVRRTAAK